MFDRKKYYQKYYIKNKEKYRALHKIRYSKNKEKIKKYIKNWKDNNIERVKNNNKKYYLKIKNEHNKKTKLWRTKNKTYFKEWRQNNKDKVNKWIKNNREYRNKYQVNYVTKRRQTDINFKILCNLRKRLLNTIKKGTKSSNTITLLGCSIEELKTHLESKFLPGMNWLNYGYNGWHIDHIIPCWSFDLTKSEEQQKCFHYTNLQPLWKKDNLNKGRKII